MAGRHRKAPPPRRGGHGRHGRHRKPPTRQHAVLPTASAIAVIAVGGVIFGHAIAHGQAPHGAAVVAPPPPAVPTPVVTTVPAKPTPPAKPKQPRERPVRHHRVAPAALTVIDVGPSCYIQVTTMQGHLIVRTIMHHGQHLTFRHHGLDVVLGNAGGVKISVNGHRAHRAGRSGQVRTFRVR
jgi:cytoskeleton protein RodZ